MRFMTVTSCNVFAFALGFNQGMSPAAIFLSFLQLHQVNGRCVKNKPLTACLTAADSPFFGNSARKTVMQPTAAAAVTKLL
jgi:hypothetical protein